MSKFYHDEEERKGFRWLVMAVLLTICFFLGIFAGYRVGFGLGKKSVPESVKLSMMQDVNKKSNENALAMLKHVEAE